MSDTAATRFRDAPLERDPCQARKWIGSRQLCYVSSCALVDQGHDVVTVSAIIDPCDPRWIWGAGEREGSDQYQWHHDRKDRGEPHRTDCPPPLLRIRHPAHPLRLRIRTPATTIGRTLSKLERRCQEELAECKHTSCVEYSPCLSTDLFQRQGPRCVPNEDSVSHHNHAVSELVEELDRFYLAHRRCGSLTSGLYGEDGMWMACSCGLVRTNARASAQPD